MISAHSVADVRAAEAALMATLPDGTLMQRAATGLAAACARLLRGPYGARVVLLVGGGDNGGDALWAGARLARRGARVDAVLLHHGRVHEPGLVALRAAGGRVASSDDGPLTSATRSAIRRADLVIDGILGIGGRGGLRDDAAELAGLARSDAGLVVAVDLPSGIDPDTGETSERRGAGRGTREATSATNSSGTHVQADVTVTFGTYKIGLLVDPAAEAAGHIELVDIGLRPHLPEPAVDVLEHHDVAALLPAPDRNADKYRRGVLGLLAGSAQYRGAAVLSAGGAISGGAGMVRYAGPVEAAAGVLTRWPEVVTSPDPAGTGRVQAWAVGSGIGDGRAEEIATVLKSGLPMLVDADGLRHLPSRFSSPALLTPHAGELAMLLGLERVDVEAKRLRHAREAARRWNATVLLKGSTTLVVAPDGRARANPTGTPALATAGSGDVLAGLAGALLATGLDPVDAGSVAAYVHGLAGHASAREAGHPGASDILRALPGVLAALTGSDLGESGLWPIT